MSKISEEFYQSLGLPYKVIDVGASLLGILYTFVSPSGFEAALSLLFCSSL
jgi:hypothetical protein